MKSKEQLEVEEWRRLGEEVREPNAKSFLGREIEPSKIGNIHKRVRKEELSEKFRKGYPNYKKFFKDEDEATCALGCT